MLIFIKLYIIKNKCIYLMKTITQRLKKLTIF